MCQKDTQTLAFAVAALQKTQEDDATSRLKRSRERNREHARRTRLRKKAQLKALQEKFSELKKEQESLRQRLEERNIASILMGLSSSRTSSTPTSCVSAPAAPETHLINANKKENPSEQRKTSVDGTSSALGVLSITIDGVPTTFNRRSHINWKSGLYTDSETGLQRRLMPEHLDALR